VGREKRWGLREDGEGEEGRDVRERDRLTKF
jgi:hypothetical protein